MRTLKWIGVNLGLFAAALLVALLVSGLIGRIMGSEPAGVVGRVLFAWGIVLGALLPGIALYLVAVSLLPNTWSPLRRRLAAVALGPIVFLIPWIEAIPSEDLGGLLFLAGVSLTPGLLVRLPSRRVSPER